MEEYQQSTNQISALMSTKLALPRTRSSLVPRETLLTRLNAVLDYKLTLLSAPAGYGKTTLVSRWIRPDDTAQERFETAWVSLDTSDNDPVRFWRYVLTACQRLAHSVVDKNSYSRALLSLRQVQFFSLDVPQPISFDVVLTEMINILAQMKSHYVLVLDDYHVITVPEIHETVATFIGHLPDTIHVILLSRGDLPLPLARLRGQGDLFELRAADLRFSLDETQHFLRQVLRFAPSPQFVASLQARTEGWIVGVKFIALALQERLDEQACDRFLETFSGSYRHILEYLVGDVLATQPEAFQTFLLQTAILKRLNGSLCDAVTERSDSDVWLEQLERGGLFIEPLDGAGEWYRYHDLFAEAMHHEARRRLGEDALCAAAGRASLWYEQHDMLSEAIEAALQTSDKERVARLIELIVVAQHFVELHEFHTLRRWLDQLPQELLQRHPWLCLLYANIFLFTSEPREQAHYEQSEEFLRISEAAWREERNMVGVGMVFAFRSLLLCWQEDMHKAEEYARQSLTMLPEDDTTWRGVSLGIIARADFLAGKLDRARQMASQSLAASLAAGNDHSARPAILMVAQICYEQGQLHQAETFYRQVLAMSDDDPDDRRKALSGLAQLNYEWNLLETAETQICESLELSKQFASDATHIEAGLLYARIVSARGEYEQARQYVQTLLSKAQSSLLLKSPELYREVLTCQAHFQLIDGDIAACMRWSTADLLSQETISFRQQEREALLVARLLLAQEKADEVVSDLEPWLLRAQAEKRQRRVLEIQLLMALAYASRKQTREARQLLHDILVAARVEGYQRLFLDQGESMAALLRTCLLEVREELVLNNYGQTILSAFSATQDDSHSASDVVLLEPLSPQERRVLRLLALGRSNPAIAGELVVSVNTIRTQVQSIYRKLNVNNRVEAVETARHLQLL
jgi:LuxR family maltose regulon positive regulatory protein